VLRGIRWALLALAVGVPRAQGAPRLVPAKVDRVLAEIHKPGARAVLLNVWATWCEPCREEMPEIVRAYRAYKQRGLRLVLVSADFDEAPAEAQKFLAAQGVDFTTFQKVGDDMSFIDGIDRRWTGALPASFLFDDRGRVVKFWREQVSGDELTAKLDEVLNARR
jgi:thiol-disulfide isomerase/thioredoxin